jgi:hypothetical protein
MVLVCAAETGWVKATVVVLAGVEAVWADAVVVLAVVEAVWAGVLVVLVGVDADGVVDV